MYVPKKYGYMFDEAIRPLSEQDQKKIANADGVPYTNWAGKVDSLAAMHVIQTRQEGRGQFV